MNNTLIRRRIWYYYPYVLSADVLSAEPTHADDHTNLRNDASCDGYCYVKFTRSFGDGSYLARVAASPPLLHHQGYTVVLDEAHIIKALPCHDFLMKGA